MTRVESTVFPRITVLPANSAMPEVDSQQEISPRRLVSEDQPAPAEKGAPWQFNLREAFGFVTAVAGGAAVARLSSYGAFVLAAGIYAAWLNARGRLVGVQTRRMRPPLFYAAWMILGASLFLPSLKGCNNTEIRGWEAAAQAAQWEIAAAAEIVHDGNWPESDQWLEGIGFFGRITLVNAANLLAILSPLLLWRLQRGHGQALGAVLAFSSVAVWSIPLSDGLLIGCYVWCAGFLILTMSCPMGWRLFAAMATLAAVFAATAT